MQPNHTAAQRKLLAAEAIRIGQINLARSRVATEEIRKYALDNKLDVHLIQKPYTHKNRVTGLGPGARFVQKNHGTPWAAIAMYKEDCTVVHLKYVTTTELAVIHIDTGTIKVNLVSLYCKVAQETKKK